VRALRCFFNMIAVDSSWSSTPTFSPKPDRSRRSVRAFRSRRCALHRQAFAASKKRFRTVVPIPL
jgi:hypothetical protein